jgi:hypothetical protein
MRGSQEPSPPFAIEASPLARRIPSPPAASASCGGGGVAFVDATEGSSSNHNKSDAPAPRSIRLERAQRGVVDLRSRLRRRGGDAGGSHRG